MRTEQLEWRRSKVQELAVKGFSQVEISRMLQVNKSAVSRDIQFLKQKAKDTISLHRQERLPYEYSNCIKGLDEIIKESWLIAAKAEKKGNDRDRLSSLALIKDTYSEKMNLLTNASLLKYSIKFVEDTKQKLEDSFTSEEEQHTLTSKF